jgi:hypothetical protein
VQGTGSPARKREKQVRFGQNLERAQGISYLEKGLVYLGLVYVFIKSKIPSNS